MPLYLRIVTTASYKAYSHGKKLLLMTEGQRVRAKHIPENKYFIGQGWGHLGVRTDEGLSLTIPIHNLRHETNEEALEELLSGDWNE